MNHLTWNILYNGSLVVHVMCLSLWMVCMSSGLGCLICVVCKIRILMTDVSYLRCAVWKMMKSVCHIWICHHCLVVTVNVLLFVPPLKLMYGSLFLYSMDQFSCWFNGCHWLLKYNISVKIPRNSVSSVGINLCHSKYKGSFVGYIYCQCL